MDRFLRCLPRQSSLYFCSIVLSCVVGYALSRSTPPPKTTGSIATGPRAINIDPMGKPLANYHYHRANSDSYNDIELTSLPFNPPPVPVLTKQEFDDLKDWQKQGSRLQQEPQQAPVASFDNNAPSIINPASNKNNPRLVPFPKITAENEAENIITKDDVSAPTLVTPLQNQSSTTNINQYGNDSDNPPISRWPHHDQQIPSRTQESSPKHLSQDGSGPRLERFPPFPQTEQAEPFVAANAAPFEADNSPSNQQMTDSSLAKNHPHHTQPIIEQSIVEQPTTEQLSPSFSPPIESQPVATNHSIRHLNQHEMRVVVARANDMVQHGISLASRGAYYSARKDFLNALRLVAQALDAQHSTHEHRQALQAAIVALQESDAILASSNHPESNDNVAPLIAAHKTPVLKGIREVSSLAALQHYYTYAQQQFSKCSADVTAGSAALYGLGKTYTVISNTNNDSLIGSLPKAIAFHQAALKVDQRNYMAANELGVLYARCGRLQHAKKALAHSASIASQPAVWHNLSVVHQQLGEFELAQITKNYAKRAARKPQKNNLVGAPQKPVVWVNSREFAKTSQPNRSHAAPQKNQNNRTTAKPKAPKAAKSSWNWWFK